MQSASEARKRPEPAKIPDNPYLQAPAQQIPQNPFLAQQAQNPRRLELPQVPPQRTDSPPPAMAKREEPGSAKIEPGKGSKITEALARMREAMEAGEGGSPPIYHRERPEGRPRGQGPSEEYSSNQRLDRMSRLGSVAGRRPAAEPGVIAVKKKEPGSIVFTQEEVLRGEGGVPEAQKPGAKPEEMKTYPYWKGQENLQTENQIPKKKEGERKG